MYLDELDSYRYQLSHGNLIDGSLFWVQELYYTHEVEKRITFDPLIWLASHIKGLCDKPEFIKLYNRSKVPHAMFLHNLPLTSAGFVYYEHKVNICKVALVERDCKGVDFDPKGYYSIYNEQIEHYFSYEKKSTCRTNEEKACVFYICYGYHKGFELKPIDALKYIASHPELIAKFATDKEAGMKHYYEHKWPITFEPLSYVASHLEKLKDMVACDGSVDEERVAKHFIRNKAGPLAFDHWLYLANNHQRIRKILRTMGKPGERHTDYDVILLTRREIARDYIKKKGKSRYNAFVPAVFVKRYIDDDNCVNYHKSLSLETAAEHFVKYYVISERVRYEASVLYRVVSFAQRRVADSLRQIPYNAARYIVEVRLI